MLGSGRCSSTHRSCYQHLMLTGTHLSSRLVITMQSLQSTLRFCMGRQLRFYKNELKKQTNKKRSNLDHRTIYLNFLFTKHFTLHILFRDKTLTTIIYLNVLFTKHLPLHILFTFLLLHTVVCTHIQFFFFFLMSNNTAGGGGWRERGVEAKRKLEMSLAKLSPIAISCTQLVPQNNWAKEFKRSGPHFSPPFPQNPHFVPPSKPSFLPSLKALISGFPKPLISPLPPKPSFLPSLKTLISPLPQNPHFSPPSKP